MLVVQASANIFVTGILNLYKIYMIDGNKTSTRVITLITKSTLKFIELLFKIISSISKTVIKEKIKINPYNHLVYVKFENKLKTELKTGNIYSIEKNRLIFANQSLFLIKY